MSDKSDTTSTGSKTLALILAALSVIGFVAVIVTTILATRELGDAYRTITQTEYEANDVLMLAYNDHLYAELGHGMSVDPADTDVEATVAAFLESSLRAIQPRVLGVGLVYALLVAVPAALLLNRAFYGHTWITANALGLLPALVYLVFVVVAVVSTFACGMPFYWVGGTAFVSLLVGAVTIQNAGNILGFVMDKVRLKGLVVILAVPAVIALFSVGFFCEYGLFAEPGPDRLTGAAMVGAAAFELLSPASGISLELVRQEIGVGIAWPVIVAYYVRNELVRILMRRWRKRIHDEHVGGENSPTSW